MPAKGRIAQRARIRKTFTGESAQHAQEQLLSSAELIPAATDRQAALESQVMLSLGGGREYWAHPLGIASVLPFKNRIIIILDGATQSYGQPFEMNLHAAQLVLPYAEPEIQVNGVIGLRVSGMSGRDLSLTHLERGGEVILRGVKGTRWHEILSELKDNYREAGLVPLWHLDKQSRHEIDHENAYRKIVNYGTVISWLGSGLLRRVALWHTASTAYTTSSWKSDGDWVFELDSYYGIGNDHGKFLSLLMDAKWGIDLKVEKYTCECKAPWSSSPYHMKACYYYLTNRDSSIPGRLQLRFRTLGPAYEVQDREQFLEAGAEPSWVDRVYPALRKDEKASTQSSLVSRRSK
ncbi:hypothetical protein [Herbidospora sp. NBRC 101105]|uniref:hypothetical protein n=1 Tax=Herbidospora sp. NBRC 101105 TaxID=3032195 RepID=UPI0024A035DD|nr:hypothetical protein [Herbidospora sp. NBRC 101105]GLX96761.1 hypothetical protein Hesp01_47110 [Herbidospora sp. NBRC 101105]